jgi:hypothetical protein
MLLARDFSFFLSKNKDARSFPYDGSPVMHIIKLVSMDTGLSSNRYPLCTRISIIFMHALISWLCPEFGMSNRLRRFAFYNPLAHTYGLMTIMWASKLMNFIMNLLGTSYGTFFSSMISWSMYFRAGIIPYISPSIMTPFRIGGSTNGYMVSFCKWMCATDNFLGRI